MKKKTRNGIILSSLAAIAVASSLIAGSTYALFTSKDEVNIAVTSGKVDVTATISDLVAYTPTSIASDGTLVDDENIAKQNSNTQWTFGNGGTASYGNTTGELALDRMTPGDKVTFKINIANNSNVVTKYRTVIQKVSPSDDTIYNALSFDIGGLSKEASLVWQNLAIPTTLGEVVTSFDCAVELPTTVSGSEYMDKTCTLQILVEAVQGNAKTSNEGATYLIHNDAELKECFAKIGQGENIVLANDISLTCTGDSATGVLGAYDTYLCTPNVVFDLNGKTITVNSNDIECLAIVASNVTFKNGKIKSGTNESSKSGYISYPLLVTSCSKNIVLEELEFFGGVSVEGISTVSFKNCKITATNHFCVYLEDRNEVTIESGEFYSTTDKIHFFMGQPTDKIILNGGTFVNNTCYYSGSGTFINNSSVIVTKKQHN